MKKLILASVSAIALLGVAACSENKDSTTTQSVKPPASAPSTTVKPETGTSAPKQGEPMQQKPAQPAAPAQ